MRKFEKLTMAWNLGSDVGKFSFECPSWKKRPCRCYGLPGVTRLLNPPLNVREALDKDKDLPASVIA
ncbi:hypothetical protein V6N11_020591 [Hibiscus sabdariffa]|uniref:Uncharacterized protein n=1 Tax=Hibiscus sabdariffa TaxID=183260 RepID=A0ABR2Q8V1_9ROSI